MAYCKFSRILKPSSEKKVHRQKNERSIHRAPATLLERELRPEVLAFDDGPQAHRVALFNICDRVLFYRGHFCHLVALGAADAPRGSGASRDLQQTVHDARHHDDFLFSDPVDPLCAGKFFGSHDDRSAGPGVPSSEPRQLVYLYYWRSVHACGSGGGRSRYRLDLL